MTNQNSWEILRRPIISEKSVEMSELDKERKYVFEVSRDARKPAIKKAVEEVFSVRVKTVNVMNMKGKTKRYRFKRGKTRQWKKAVVTLEGDQTIEIL